MLVTGDHAPVAIEQVVEPVTELVVTSSHGVIEQRAGVQPWRDRLGPTSSTTTPASSSCASGVSSPIARRRGARGCPIVCPGVALNACIEQLSTASSCGVTRCVRVTRCARILDHPCVCVRRRRARRHPQRRARRRQRPRRRSRPYRDAASATSASEPPASAGMPNPSVPRPGARCRTGRPRSSASGSARPLPERSLGRL